VTPLPLWGSGVRRDIVAETGTELLPGAAPYNEPVSLADGRALPLAPAVAA